MEWQAGKGVGLRTAKSDRAAQVARRGRVDGHNTRLDVASVELMATKQVAQRRFFSRAVRLQPDRGQQVVTSGPYRFVRHPGYSGGLLLLLSAGFALGSWIAMAPILLMLPLMVRRTLIEERMLAHALPGYADDMRRVRSRIIPRVW